MKSFIVSVYHVDQAYGGPEEGGWWFTCGEFVRIVRVFHSSDGAWEYCGRLNHRLKSRKFGPNAGRREISSVLSEGVLEADVHEGLPPRYFPERRPHYE